MLVFHRNQVSCSTALDWVSLTVQLCVPFYPAPPADIPPSLSSDYGFLGGGCLSLCSFTAHHNQNDYSNNKSQGGEHCSSNHSQSVLYRKDQNKDFIQESSSFTFSWMKAFVGVGLRNRVWKRTARTHVPGWTSWKNIWLELLKSCSSNSSILFV